MKKIIVSSWNDGKQNSNGNGYGIRVGKRGREYFSKHELTIKLSIENSEFFEVKITDGFWRNCTEFRDKRIGKWLIDNKFAPWEKGNNPKFFLTILGNNEYLLTKN